ncbi:LysR family transcriptional regulator [Edwardsiella anguillarum]|uniref:LysR family transcriptional regulator n=1 Tax=Edwardsiella anguillarum TaxID=1821960 RepID=UPI0024B830C8|nr:LysR family transcriptional regulator [Edwardsiella anguillarum]WHP81287.1 LysR family transcriptional regulator [Edwardsiella anguillarum]WHQ18788.1 LysR family transcriptional regulator [Edwardsiella anguillarum]WHQ22330.1 LysR family transcriptional regulator [Edwardsiella anguillarum]WHQ25852.1 LysR family transcriptional regulator [Edwardsiella anguillarum]WHQ29375.1 LysR family transcriptional regulator [Edwardsiella anguillarum]
MLQNDISKVIRSDINLLITLYVLLKTRQVSKAARQLYLGQSAVSHQLARLRELFQDPLLIRSAGDMLLTPFAEHIYPALETTVLDLKSILDKPQESEHIFPIKDTYRICVPSDLHIASTTVFFYDFLMQEGLGSDVSFEVFPRYDQCIFDLNEGKIDFFFGSLNDVTGNICELELLESEYCLTVRRDHPMAERTVTLREITKYPWIDFLFLEGIKKISNEIWGEAIANMKCPIKTSSTTATVELLLQSNAVSMLPIGVILKNNLSKLKVKGLGNAKAKIKNHIYWHKIMENDSFHRHIREVLARKYIKEKITTLD